MYDTLYITRMRYSKEDLIYLAGYIDADGFFGIYGKYIGTGRIGVTNCCKPTLDWLQATFGGRVSVQREAQGNWRRCWSWILGGRKTVELCEQLLPYLKEKQPRAQCLLDLYKLPKLNPHIAVSEGNMAQRRAIKDKLKELTVHEY